jgi:hypothetical protein
VEEDSQDNIIVEGDLYGDEDYFGDEYEDGDPQPEGNSDYYEEEAGFDSEEKKG